MEEEKKYFDYNPLSCGKVFLVELIQKYSDLPLYQEVLNETLKYPNNRALNQNKRQSLIKSLYKFQDYYSEREKYLRVL